jgi:hypothetical protein
MNMDESGMRSPEIPEAQESGEQADALRLEEVTFEPGALMERQGDFQEAEELQSSLEAVFATVEAGTLSPTSGVEQIGSLPSPLPRTASQSGAGGDRMACDGSSKDEALPMEGDVQVSRRFTWGAESIPGSVEDDGIKITPEESSGVSGIPLPEAIGEIAISTVSNVNELKSSLREEISDMKYLLKEWLPGQDYLLLTTNWADDSGEGLTYVNPPQTIQLTRDQVENRIILCESLLDSMSDLSQLDNLNLEDNFEMSDAILATISNTIKNIHDIKKAIIQNIKP